MIFYIASTCSVYFREPSLTIIIIIIASVASYMYELAGAFLWYIYIYIYIYIFVSMGRPFGPAWAPRNAQRANVGPAGLGSMVNVIALKTATLVLSRG